MDVQLISTAIRILQSISAVAWTGSLIFFLAVLVPVIRHMEGEMRASASAMIFRSGRVYLRTWGVLTVALAIAVELFPIASPMAVLKRFDPLSIFLIDAITFAAYLIIGEGFLIRSMGMYASIFKSLDTKLKPQGIAHLVVLERKITSSVALQMSFLVLALVLSAYLPIPYNLP